MILIPWIGTRGSERMLIALSAVGAAGGAGAADLAFARSVAATAAAGGVSGAGGLARGARYRVPGMLIAYGRRIMTSSGRSEILYTGEGMNSSIAITRWNDGAVQFHVSGKVEASTEPYDMRLQRMLGHMPALVHPQPRSVLVVGFGAGVTAGTFVLHPERPAHRDLRDGAAHPARSPRATSASENYDVLNDPRCRSSTTTRATSC